QIKEQVQRPLECLQEYLQRIRRNVEVLGELGHRLAVDDGKRHFRLEGIATGVFGREDGRFRRIGVVHDRQLRLGSLHGGISHSLSLPSGACEFEDDPGDGFDRRPENAAKDTESEQAEHDYKAVAFEPVEPLSDGLGNQTAQNPAAIQGGYRKKVKNTQQYIELSTENTHRQKELPDSRTRPDPLR